MIDFTEGNLLDANAQALVNTVNTVGVMGKGIALQFREAFPANYEEYRRACEVGEVRVGQMFVTENSDLTGPRYIINFPTKAHWKGNSKIEYIESGLDDLVRVITENRIESIAVPPLGCGNGGLSWNQVEKLILQRLGGLEAVRITIYSPTRTYQSRPKTRGVTKPTPARAMLVSLVRDYWSLGFECSNLEVQKLAYFLSRFVNALGEDDPLKLAFAANQYGPYSDNLRHLLDSLDGSFLQCDQRLADAGPFEPIYVKEERYELLAAYIAENLEPTHQEALRSAKKLIDGFQTPFLMELLATVDWCLSEMSVRPTVDDLRAALHTWPGGKASAERKVRIFSESDLALALQRLTSFAPQLYPTIP